MSIMAPPFESVNETQTEIKDSQQYFPVFTRIRRSLLLFSQWMTEHANENGYRNSQSVYTVLFMMSSSTGLLTIQFVDKI